MNDLIGAMCITTVIALVLLALVAALHEIRAME